MEEPIDRKCDKLRHFVTFVLAGKSGFARDSRLRVQFRRWIAIYLSLSSRFVASSVTCPKEAELWETTTYPSKPRKARARTHGGRMAGVAAR